MVTAPPPITLLSVQPSVVSALQKCTPASTRS